MAQSIDYLKRLAQIARDLEHKRNLCAALQDLLETAGQSGIVVAGESWMLDALRARLEQAQHSLEALEQIGTIQAASEPLEALEDLISAVEWEVAEQTRDELTQKVERQKEHIRQQEDQIAEWQARTRELREQLAKARELRAPLRKVEGQVQRLQGLVEQAERALREQQFVVLEASLEQLTKSEKESRQVITQIEEKVDQAKQFARQADLLLLQSPLVNQRYQYTVLLRTPSEPGVHGINIQSSSTLVQQDRKLMSDIIDQVTQAIDAGLARQFSLRTAASTASPTPALSEATPETAVANPEENEPPEGTRHLRLAENDSARLTPEDMSHLAQNVGDLMYRLFMPEEMQRYLNDTPCSITITTNDLELPWELMCYEGKFLCLERPVARMPMGRALPRRESQPLHSGKLRFLLIYADPAGNLPSARREVEQIRDGLSRDWQDQIEIEMLDREQARGRKLNEVLRAGIYDVIHYAGHAAFDPHDPDLSGLLLHDDEVFFAQKIRRLLEGRPLVFLNACQSGRTANEQEPQKVGQYLQEPAEGLASSFIYGGALGCIGALWPIYDRPAAEFAIQFYNKVLEGYMIGEAMRQARRQIREEHPDQITWAAFVLYGDPTFRLVS